MNENLKSTSFLYKIMTFLHTSKGLTNGTFSKLPMNHSVLTIVKMDIYKINTKISLSLTINILLLQSSLL
jgi:hypothetical protein